MTNNTPEYLSLSEAAERLGYASKSTLALKCREGRVTGAQKVGTQWIIPSTWVDGEIAKPQEQKAGGPRGKGVRGKNIKE